MVDSFCSCEGASVAPLFRVTGDVGGEFSLDRCTSCGLVWDSPMPDEQLLNEAYQQDYYGSQTTKFNPVVEAWTRYSGRSRARALLKQHGKSDKSQRVLDVGCGRGVLLAGFQQLGVNALGLERPDSGFDVIDGVETTTLDELVQQGRKFDVIVLWHVLEHLPEPEQMLAQIQQLLTDDGSLFVEVPNFASLQSRIFKKNWFHLDVPRHLFHFTPATLKLKLKDRNFETVSMHTFSFDQNLYGFLQSLLNSMPFLPPNHLYSLLKPGATLWRTAMLLLYVPIVVIASIPAVLELTVSRLFGSGAVISIHARKRNQELHD
ncbi:MAG: class I SAM-dependent methyltransferase [Pseudomonadales bacterium]|nr:class I SAM-dependent methyltransferase [Pseudomonadales bacterium]